MTVQQEVELATSTDQRELLRLATAGSVDDGKSTLIGRLLLDTKLLLSDQLEAVSRRGGTPDLAAITDGLRAEREQGITIDVAYRYFATPRRTFILADTPGHERYTRNMFTGASTADLVIVLIDARSGVVVQTRRHAQIASLLRVRHVVVAVNKMDLVGFSRERFEEVAADARQLGRALGLPDMQVVPISALDGDNVVDRSARTPWYEQKSLLEILETVDVSADRDLERSHLRLPIQWVARPKEGARRVYTGQLAAGSLKAGDEIVVAPAGTTAIVASVDTLDPDRDRAVPPMSVGVTLTADIDVGRGDVLVAPDNQPPAARELDATICWMAEGSLAPGRRYALKHTTRTVRATVQEIIDRWDPETLEVFTQPTHLGLNDIGRVSLRTSTPVLADPYRQNSETGAFILIDEYTNETVGAGIIRHAREVHAATGEAPRHHLASLRVGPRGPLGGAAADRRDRLVDRAAGVGQVDDRGGARASPARAGPRGLPDRRRQHPPWAVRRSRVLARRPRRARPPSRACGAAVRRLRGGRGGFAGVAVLLRPRDPAQAARGRRAAVPRGPCRHQRRGVRTARPQGPLRARPSGGDEGVHRR